MLGYYTDTVVHDFVFRIEKYKPLLNYNLKIEYQYPIDINSHSRISLGDVDGEAWFNIIGLCSFILFIINTHKELRNQYCHHIKGDSGGDYRYIMLDDDYKNIDDIEIRRLVSISNSIRIILMKHHEDDT